MELLLHPRWGWRAYCPWCNTQTRWSVLLQKIRGLWRAGVGNILKSESVSALSPVLLIVTPLSVAWQASLSMNFPGKNTGVGSIPFSRESSWHRDQTQVSCIAGRFFTIWATREAQPYWGRSPKKDHFCQTKMRNSGNEDNLKQKLYLALMENILLWMHQRC